MGRKPVFPEVGDKFGKLTVTRTRFKKNGFWVSSCLCECGQKCFKRNSDLFLSRRENILIGCGCSVGKRGAAKSQPDWVVERNNKLIMRRLEGASCITIGEEFGLSRERVCQILRPLKLSRLREPVDRTEVEKLIRKGFILREIASEIDRGLEYAAVVIYGDEHLNSAWKQMKRVRAVRTAKFRDEAFNEKYKDYSNNDMTFDGRIKGDMCWFKCSCGNRHAAEMQNVKAGRTKSCGCRQEKYARSMLLGFRWNKETGTMENGQSQVHQRS